MKLDLKKTQRSRLPVRRSKHKGKEIQRYEDNLFEEDNSTIASFWTEDASVQSSYYEGRDDQSVETDWSGSTQETGNVSTSVSYRQGTASIDPSMGREFNEDQCSTVATSVYSTVASSVASEDSTAASYDSGIDDVDDDEKTSSSLSTSTALHLREACCRDQDKDDATAETTETEDTELTNSSVWLKWVGDTMPFNSDAGEASTVGESTVDEKSVESFTLFKAKYHVDEDDKLNVGCGFPVVSEVAAVLYEVGTSWMLRDNEIDAMAGRIRKVSVKPKTNQAPPRVPLMKDGVELSCSAKKLYVYV